MEFFSSAVDSLQTIVIALGTGLACGVVSTSERVDNPAANGEKQVAI